MSDFTMRPATPDLNFILGYLSSYPLTTYDEALQAAAREGHKLSPIVWARARRTLAPLLEAEAATGQPHDRDASTAVPAATIEADVVSEGDGSPADHEEYEDESETQELAAPEPLAPARHAPRVEHFSIAIDITGAADLQDWQQVVDRINDGARVALEYSNGTWRLIGGG